MHVYIHSSHSFHLNSFHCRCNLFCRFFPNDKRLFFRFSFVFEEFCVCVRVYFTKYKTPSRLLVPDVFCSQFSFSSFCFFIIVSYSNRSFSIVETSWTRDTWLFIKLCDAIQINHKQWCHFHTYLEWREKRETKKQTLFLNCLIACVCESTFDPI